MFVDHQTYQELEIFQGLDGRRPLAQVLDRTSTTLGARRLRERLGRPISDPGLLEMALQGTRFLASINPLPDLDGAAVHAASRYLDSRIMSLQQRSLRPGVLEAGWIALRDQELLTVAGEGVPAVRAVVESLERTVPPLIAARPPRSLAVLLESLTGLLRKLDLSRLWAGRSRPWRILAADHEIRVRHRGDLVRLLSLVADLDLEISCARLVQEGYAVPQVDSASPFRIELQGLRHPLVPEPVANPFHMTSVDGVLLVTGPNMAGKTTYIRTVGLCVHLAHCALPVPADRMTFRPLDALFLSLNPRDDLGRGVSLFLGEVLRVRTVLERAAGGRPVLAVFDELFRGTNQADALEASRRVCAGAARCPTFGLLVSSHLTELADDLRKTPGVALGSFEGRVEGDRDGSGREKPTPSAQ